MTELPEVFHNSCLSEPLTAADLSQYNLLFFPLLLAQVKKYFEEQKPWITLNRIYGVINENQSYTITIETSFFMFADKEISFSVAFTPVGAELTKTKEYIAEKLLFEYNLTKKMLSH